MPDVNATVTQAAATPQHPLLNALGALVLHLATAFLASYLQDIVPTVKK